MINNENRSKVFLVIIAILLIANIGMLVFFLQKKGPVKADRPDKNAYIANLLKEEVGFNQQQLSQYDTLSSQRREKVSKLFENIRNNKTVQFKQLAALDFNDSAINTIADQSAASQKIVDMNMFNHIKSIRLLCSPEQLPKFDSVFVKVFNWREELRKKK